ncbi:VTT domain-containing protein [Desulfocurvibacter africanus]|uniref:TVP38/TMEM64 family protein n=1 Tax=Desulfocurvibacter africanus TaxID=873 RepID=UPI002FD9E65F
MSQAPSIPSARRQPAAAMRILAGALLPALILAIGAALVHWGGLGDQLGQEWIDAHIRGQGLAGWLLFVGLMGLATSLAVPRQAVSFLGGYAFGFIGGSLLSLAAAGFGCVLGFWYARLTRLAWQPELMSRLIGRRMTSLAQVDGFLRDNPFGMALTIRLLPVGNNSLTNLLAGISGVPFGPFMAGSLLGYAPQTLIFALLGSGMSVAPAWRVSLALVLLAVSSLLGWRMYRRSGLARD